MLTHWLNLFIATKRISECHHFCKWKFLYIVNSIGGSFCWNYVTDTLYSHYAGSNVCCNYASFEAPLQLCRCYFRLQLSWWIFLLQSCNRKFHYSVRSLLHRTVYYYWTLFCCTYATDSFRIKYVGDNFYCIYACGNLCCSYAGGTCCSA